MKRGIIKFKKIENIYRILKIKKNSDTNTTLICLYGDQKDLISLIVKTEIKKKFAFVVQNEFIPKKQIKKNRIIFCFNSIP